MTTSVTGSSGSNRGLLPLAPNPSPVQPAIGRLFSLAGHRQRGFTLLELMVVIVIVGVVMTFVTLSLGGDRRAEQLQREAQRLAALMDLASEEAILRSQQIGVRFGNTDYEFYRLEAGSWQPLSQDNQFRRRALPTGISLDLELEDAPPLSLDTAEEDQAPQVFILSSGEMTPFILTFSAAETRHRYLVKGGLTGELEVD